MNECVLYILNCLVRSVISPKCLGVSSVHLFNVDIKLSWHFFILNVTGSVNIASGSASGPLKGPVEPSLHWPSWATCCARLWSNHLGAGLHMIEKTLPPRCMEQPGTQHLVPIPSESAVGVAGM